MPRRDSRSEVVDCTVQLLDISTEKAWCVTEGLTDKKTGELIKHWLPKSQTEITEQRQGGIVVITMPRWLFDEKGFTPDD